MQIDFLIELFIKAKEQGIHTCIDTSGICFQPKSKEWMLRLEQLLLFTDLILLDLKHIDNNKHLELTNQSNEPILAFAQYLSEINFPVWIRHVIVPGYTFIQEYLYKLGRYIGQLKNVKALDILPYHSMGIDKYKGLNMKYPLEGMRDVTKEEAIAARQIIINGIRDERNNS